MKFLDFFSGIGGFRLGMEMAGHECVGHCEIDKFANKSYMNMHQPKAGEWYADDITNVRPEELPDAEIYCGGFPCQAFSIAGKRGGFEDTRGTLFFEVMRLARVRRPKYLFLENVRGLLSHDGGKTFGTIIQTLGECGYNAEWQMCNSKNFGVPQNRERIFIIGYIRRGSRPKIFPIGGSNKNFIKKIGDLQISKFDQSNRVYSIDGVCPTLMAANTNEKIQKILIDKKVGHNIRSREFKQSGWKDICPTLCARDYKDPKNVLEVKETTKIRRLTPKEYFRLQGFPDEYFERAQEVNSDSQLYKQAGNSVTVNVIYEIAKKFD